MTARRVPSAADAVTFANAALGLTAMAMTLVVALAPKPAGTAGPVPVAAAILLAALADLLDGVVARRYGSSQAGRALDTLADGISFGCAPALLVAVHGAGGVLGALVLAVVVFRLAREFTAPHGDGDFRGMPAPMGALAVVAVVALAPPPVIAWTTIVLLATAMAWDAPWPKPRGRLALLAGGWAALGGGVLTVAALGLPGGDAAMRVVAVTQVVAALAGVPLVTVRRTGRTRTRYCAVPHSALADTRRHLADTR